MKDRVYAIVHLHRKEVYVGRTYRTLVERWAEHLNAAANSSSSKTLSEALRHEPHAWEILECEYSETASEAEWIEKFRADGYFILNDTGGNRAKPKARDTAKEREWRAMNMSADQRLNKLEGSGAEVQRRIRELIQNGTERRNQFFNARSDK